MALRIDPERLRERILAHLLEVGSDSISGVARVVSQDREHPIHRLTVAGYLAAMAEGGVLREVDRPPSKHYQVADPSHLADVYRRIGAAVRQLPMSVEDRTRAALAALVEVLGRPVFRAELQHTRLPLPDDLPRADVSEQERLAYRALVPSRLPRIDVPRHDPMFKAPPGHDVVPVLAKALLAATQAEAYAWQPGTKVRQAPLPRGDEP